MNIKSCFRYQYNKDLVSLLNEFADRTQTLPTDWEMKIDPNGKVTRIRSSEPEL